MPLRIFSQKNVVLNYKTDSLSTEVLNVSEEDLC